MEDPQSHRHAHTDFSQTLSYGDYLSLTELLSLQRPLTQAHDEVLFITIHQISELWMKLLIHELQFGMGLLEQGVIDPSLKMLSRVCRAQEQMTNAWEVLKTMTPADYLEFRGNFGQASGFQSYQYRMVEFLLGNRNPFMMRPHQHQPEPYALLQQALHQPSVYDLALRLLSQTFRLPTEVLGRDYALPYQPHQEVALAWLEVYRQPGQHWGLYHLAEKLMDVEDNFRRWRFNHLTAVERLIGQKTGSGGTAGVGYLRKVLEVVLFPEIWQVRSQL